MHENIINVESISENHKTILPIDFTNTKHHLLAVIWNDMNCID